MGDYRAGTGYRRAAALHGVRRGGCEIADICADKSGIEELVELMNRYDASEINAADIVEDFIAAR